MEIFGEKKKDGLLSYGFLIVAMAAGEDLITTWGANHASSFVMLASRNPKPYQSNRSNKQKRVNFIKLESFLRYPCSIFPK